ncbi:MAG TPA: hypothetical protein VGC30_12670 [Dokdonella sp.]
MSTTSLSHLYRRMTAARPLGEVDAAAVDAVVSPAADAELASAHREAVAAQLASSARGADLARFLRALAPASAELVEQVGGRRRSAHPSRVREARAAGGARRGFARALRWAGPAAVALAIAFGVGVAHRGATSGDAWRSVAAGAKTEALPDRIFSTSDRIFAAWVDGRQEAAPRRRADELFRGDFSG